MIPSSHDPVRCLSKDWQRWGQQSARSMTSGFSYFKNNRYHQHITNQYQSMINDHYWTWLLASFFREIKCMDVDIDDTPRSSAYQSMNLAIWLVIYIYIYTYSSIFPYIYMCVIICIYITIIMTFLLLLYNIICKYIYMCVIIWDCYYGII